jgi:CAAX protease family protein
MVWSPDATWRVAILLLIVTVSSVAEEVLFRGLVYNALRQRMPPIVAAVVQALAFGFLHSYGVVHSVLASALGFAFAGVYEWRKTLLAPILLHVFQNVVVVLVAAAAAYSAANAPVLGVTGEPAEEGCRITIVYPGSAAEAAALRPGDVITVMDGWGIADIKDVATVVRQKQAGDTVVIEFIRDGERQEARAVLRKRE